MAGLTVYGYKETYLSNGVKINDAIITDSDLVDCTLTGAIIDTSTITGDPTLTISGADGTATVQAGDVIVNAGDADVNTNTGGELTFTTGDGGTTSGDAGGFSVTTGTAVVGDGGDVVFTSGNGGSTSGDAGGFSVTTGTAVVGDGGDVVFTSGNGGSTSGDGGAFVATAGIALLGDGGSVEITAGGAALGNGGSFTIVTGDGSVSDGAFNIFLAGTTTGATQYIWPTTAPTSAQQVLGISTIAGTDPVVNTLAWKGEGIWELGTPLIQWFSNVNPTATSPVGVIQNDATYETSAGNRHVELVSTTNETGDIYWNVGATTNWEIRVKLYTGGGLGAQFYIIGGADTWDATPTITNEVSVQMDKVAVDTLLNSNGTAFVTDTDNAYTQNTGGNMYIHLKKIGTTLTTRIENEKTGFSSGPVYEKSGTIPSSTTGDGAIFGVLSTTAGTGDFISVTYFEVRSYD